VLATFPIAAVLGTAMIAPSSAAACPVGGYCTDSEGIYHLVPPFPTTGEFSDCVWKVHVEWGDGNSTDYTFDAENGLSGSHPYPHYGKYVATVTTSDGYHKNSPRSCPGERESYSVYWQTAQEIAEEEAMTKVEKEAREKKEAEEKAAAEAKKIQENEERAARERAAQEKFGGSKGSGSGGSGSGNGAQGGTPSFWQSCRGGQVLVHGVGCPKARKVLGRARRTDLIEGGPQQALGFTCRLTDSRPHRILCRRGKSRILGPL
jgi:hypothetical protein